MGESAEDLRPDDAEISNPSIIYLGKDTVENVTEQMHTEAGHDSLSTSIAAPGKYASNQGELLRNSQMVGHVAERERHWDLQEQTD